MLEREQENSVLLQILLNNTDWGIKQVQIFGYLKK